VSEDKYPLIAQLKKARKKLKQATKLGRKPTGAGARRDDKLLKAEQKALGIKPKKK
jgi:hypothetical protein